MNDREGGVWIGINVVVWVKIGSAWDENGLSELRREGDVFWCFRRFGRA